MPSERTARLEAQLAECLRRLDGHSRTLYGANGNGGLTADVTSIGVSHNAHVKATEAALAQTADVLLGENRDGSEGVLHDVDDLMRRQEVRSRLLWLFIGAAATELTALLAIWLTHGK